MPPTVFLSLDAILAEPQEAAFRSLLALRRLRVMEGANSLDEVLIEAGVVEQLSIIVSEHRPNFVITNLHLPDIQRTQMRDHMRKLGLATIGENLAEPWSTDVRQSCTRAEEISAWLANHADTDVTYAIIDVEEFNQQVNGTCRGPGTVLIDSGRRKLSDLASAVGSILSQTSGGNPRA